MDLVKRTPGQEADLTDLKFVGDKVNFGYFVAYPDLQWLVASDGLACSYTLHLQWARIGILLV